MLLAGVLYESDMISVCIKLLLYRILDFMLGFSTDLDYFRSTP